jgi:hypothetical protein
MATRTEITGLYLRIQAKEQFIIKLCEGQAADVRKGVWSRVIDERIQREFLNLHYLTQKHIHWTKNITYRPETGNDI